MAEIKKELLEEARLNGKGSEREAGLRAQVAERDRRIAELESHLRALHIVALVGTESEHIFDAVTAFLAKSERSAP